jgi:diguanylate cyclase (GGDEF)-like protein
MKTNFTKEEFDTILDVIRDDFQLIRLVEPRRRRVHDIKNGLETSEVCSELWGRCDRCENCTSCRALDIRKSAFKLDILDGEIFLVISRYVVVDGTELVLELVTNSETEMMLGNNQADTIGKIISNYNHLIVTDSLTKLYNRRFLDEHLVPSFRCCGDEDQPVSIAMMDVDDFKVINDTYGHQAGDMLLRDIAGYWRRYFDSRTRNMERYVIRYGGDEFLIVAIGIPVKEFSRMMETIYDRMRKDCIYGDGNYIEFTTSFGIAGSGELEGEWKWDQLLDLADKRLYIKKGERNKK